MASSREWYYGIRVLVPRLCMATGAGQSAEIHVVVMGLLEGQVLRKK